MWAEGLARRLRTAVALIAFGVLSGVAGAHEPDSIQHIRPEEQERLAAAIEALRTGDWAGAVRDLELASRRPSLLGDYVQLFLAEGLSRLGHLTKARRTAESLAGSKSGGRLAPTALLLASALASRQGDEGGSETLLRQFLARFPNRPEAAEARYLLGLAIQAQGRRQEAAKIFRQLWLRAPASPYGEAAGDKWQALLDSGVVLPSVTRRERLGRAERLLDGGEVGKALREAEAIVSEDPEEELAFGALTVMASSLRRLGRHTEAASVVERVLSLAPADRRASLLLELGRLRWNAGALDPARRTLEHVIRKFPASPEAAQALVFKGRVLEESGRTAEAAKSYRRAMANFPNHGAASDAIWRLGWIAYLDSDFAGAARVFGRLARTSSNAAYRLAGRYWAGRSYERLGRPGEALRHFRVLLAGAPRSYYGVLAAGRYKVAPRSKVAARASGRLLSLPADPLARLAGERHFVRAEALRLLGLAEHAVGELEELSRRIRGDRAKLYGLAALWLRDEEFHRAVWIARKAFTRLAWSGHRRLPRQFWEIFYPFGWKPEIRQLARRAGVDPYLVAAVVREESSFSPLALSPAGARGLMQLMPGTARKLAARSGLAFDADDLLEEPEANLELGTTYLAELLEEFSNPRLAIAAYNAGPHRVSEWWAKRRGDDLEAFVERIPFRETRLFVKRVLVSWKEYRRLYVRSP
ncbi:MAG: transglycosylase SLT domain-containing protein [Candidatus Methylomirabilia bacterium]